MFFAHSVRLRCAFLSNGHTIPKILGIVHLHFYIDIVRILRCSARFWWFIIFVISFNTWEYLCVLFLLLVDWHFRYWLTDDGGAENDDGAAYAATPSMSTVVVVVVVVIYLFHFPHRIHVRTHAYAYIWTVCHSSIPIDALIHLKPSRKFNLE